MDWPYEAMVFNLALKLGLRDKELRFAEFHDIVWHESVFRVRGNPNDHHHEELDYAASIEQPIVVPFSDFRLTSSRLTIYVSTATYRQVCGSMCRNGRGGVVQGNHAFTANEHLKKNLRTHVQPEVNDE